MSILTNEVWEQKLFLGKWQSAEESYDVVEVATGKSLGKIGYASANDVINAAQKAKIAQKQWWALSYQERQAIFEKAVQLLTANQDEVIQWLVKESGSLQLKAGFEVNISIQILKHCIGLPSSEQGTLLPTQPGKLSMAKRVPLGVVGVISPFNFPLYLALRAVAPALALGNAVVLKPDERTAICSGYTIARIFELAGLPQGLLHVLPGGAEVGEALTLDKNIASIQFTGSTHVGRIVGENAAKTLKKVSLELGGKNSLIILDDADIELAAENIAWGAFLHSGQICMTSGRILIQEKIYEQVKERVIEKVKNFVVGNPLQSEVTIGPLINKRQSERVEQLVNEAIAHGAKLEIGGNANGVFFEPTVLADVTQDNPIFTEEIFGPVAVLIPFKSDEQAIELANDGDYGLSAGIITSNVGRGVQLGQQLNVGLLHINDQTVNDETVNPFGGFGASGNGTRIGGPANADEFTQWQWMTIQAQAPHYPF
ncbi:benzaldehyde dehydrogenase [Acinetobacter baumannii]|uniref:benzaldehyde dehydrogenase n=1 Tax=Acinetobacter baumannii TaxID=470 RepID=UPI000BF9A80A|nr:benzaldehyde dehydrogenase [Acinetobacter baumannii]MDC4876268.1 benzaldehyde dehydrogenase [Acinetobacter baumannii]MDC4887055.1 benzaldehyde dehydrogenase [Acinetobacter baumannii]MDC4925901.1 benzaldehyde dehydrogenase [Acinetobacter baumannii]MDC4940597.1 benzaldehyde dehydrogenase [Acinetobacter baumannii]MDC4945174.1 benzaldehyde dehydrogenase [Acinetobacter baumannii]